MLLHCALLCLRHERGVAWRATRSTTTCCSMMGVLRFRAAIFIELQDKTGKSASTPMRYHCRFQVNGETQCLRMI